ncbi:MAG: hypothetical protein ABJD13_15865 [Paracoccaceae bacterium]
MSSNDFGNGFPQPVFLRGARAINRKTRGHGTSNVVLPNDGCGPNQVVSVEAILERKGLQHYLSQPGVVRVTGQVGPIKYVNAEGNRKEHTFDLFVVRSDGHKTLVAVKPFEIAVRDRLDLTLQQIAACVPAGFANEVALFTDRTISRQQQVNNSRYHAIRRIDDQEAELAVEVAVRQLKGSTTISDLVDAVGLAGRAYGAILNSIYRGVLHQVSAGLIDYGTIVRSGAMS